MTPRIFHHLPSFHNILRDSIAFCINARRSLLCISSLSVNFFILVFQINIVRPGFPFLVPSHSSQTDTIPGRLDMLC